MKIKCVRSLLLNNIGGKFPTESKECGEVKTLCGPIGQKTFLLLRINDTGTFMPVAVSDHHLYLQLPKVSGKVSILKLSNAAISNVSFI